MHDSDMPQINLTHNEANMPVRATNGSAGMDVYAVEQCTIPPFSSRLINLGFEISLPKGMYARIAPRSGLALKHSIQIDAGVVDRDYRGEVKALLRNNSQTSYSINKGDRVAQLILESISEHNFVKVDELASSNRINQSLLRSVQKKCLLLRGFL